MYLNGGSPFIDGPNSGSGINIDNDDQPGGGGVYTEDMCFEEISFYETVVRDSQYWLKVVLLIMLGSLGLVGNIITTAYGVYDGIWLTNQTPFSRQNNPQHAIGTRC